MDDHDPRRGVCGRLSGKGSDTVDRAASAIAYHRDEMKIAVFGAGGVGGYFGGRLAQAGTPVAFVARGKHLEAIQDRGLRIVSPLGDALVAPVEASDDPAAIGGVDVVLLAVKTWQLDDALAKIDPLLGPETIVVPLLNGVEAADRTAAKVGASRVLGGTCKIISHFGEPGEIEVFRLQVALREMYDENVVPGLGIG